MRAIFLSFLILLAISCKKKLVKNSDNQGVKLSAVRTETTAASTTIFSGGRQVTVPNTALPLQRIILLNASLYGYLDELQLGDRVVGVSSPEYFYNEQLRQRIAEKTVQQVGSDQKYDLEKIIALRPDAVLTNYIPTFENVYKVLADQHIPVIFIDEYLAVSPLEKTSILSVFGKLFGAEAPAKAKIASIEKDYQRILATVQKARHSPKVLANEMYGNIWYMPGKESALATLIASAGGHYLFQNLEGAAAHNLSFEEVLVKSADAEVWLNAGNYSSVAEIVSINPLYAQLPIIKKGRIYGLSAGQKGKANDYFESGNVRADWVLADYAAALHPELFPRHQFRYLKQYQ